MHGRGSGPRSLAGLGAACGTRPGASPFLTALAGVLPLPSRSGGRMGAQTLDPAHSSLQAARPGPSRPQRLGPCTAFWKEGQRQRSKCALREGHARPPIFPGALPPQVTLRSAGGAPGPQLRRVGLVQGGRSHNPLGRTRGPARAATETAGHTCCLRFLVSWGGGSFSGGEPAPQVSQREGSRIRGPDISAVSGQLRKGHSRWAERDGPGSVVRPRGPAGDQRWGFAGIALTQTHGSQCGYVHMQDFRVVRGTTHRAYTPGFPHLVPEGTSWFRGARSTYSGVFK